MLPTTNITDSATGNLFSSSARPERSAQSARNSPVTCHTFPMRVKVAKLTDTPNCRKITIYRRCLPTQ